MGLTYRPTGTSELVISRLLYSICQPTEELLQTACRGTPNMIRRHITLCHEQERIHADISDK
jgi:hypothetical protein